MIFINPWVYYLINEPDKIPDLKPHNDDDAIGCVAGFCGFVISAIIYATFMYLILTFKLKYCFSVDVYMLLIILNSIVVFPIMIIMLMKLSFKIADKLIERNKR